MRLIIIWSVIAISKNGNRFDSFACASDEGWLLVTIRHRRASIGQGAFRQHRLSRFVISEYGTRMSEELFADFDRDEGRSLLNRQRGSIEFHSLRDGQHYKLIADIDLSAVANWTPLGMGDDKHNARPTPFSGSFDGAGHVISNLRINDSGKNNIGLFSVIQGSSGRPGDEVVVCNVGLENVNIAGEGASFIGALAGKAENAFLSNVYVRNGAIEGANAIGGLVGEANRSVLTNVFSEDALIIAKSGGGGIVGWWRHSENDRAYIKDVFVAGVEALNDEPFDPAFPDRFGAIVGWAPTPETPKVINGYWNGKCALCAFDLNLGEEARDRKRLKRRETFPHWNFDNDWLLLEARDMFPAPRVFHPVRLEVRLAVTEAPLLPGDTARIEVFAAYKRLSGKRDVTGNEAIRYDAIVGEALVDISPAGEVRAIAPGTVEVAVSFEGGMSRLTFVVASPQESDRDDDF